MSVCLVKERTVESWEIREESRRRIFIWKGSDKQKRDLLSGVTMEDGVSVLRVDVCMGVAVHISAPSNSLVNESVSK